MEDHTLAAIQSYLADSKHSHLRVTEHGLEAVGHGALWKGYSIFRPKPDNERIAAVTRAITNWASVHKTQLAQNPQESLALLDQLKNRFSKQQAFTERLSELEASIQMIAAPSQITIELRGGESITAYKQLLGVEDNVDWSAYNPQTVKALLSALVKKKPFYAKEAEAADLGRLCTQLGPEARAMANTLVQPPRFGSTALSEAMERNEPDLVQTLLEQGYGKIDSRAFLVAARAGDIQQLQTLFDAGGSPDPKGDTDKDPLQSALKLDQPEAFHALLPFYLQSENRRAKLAIEFCTQRAARHEHAGGLLQWALKSNHADLARLLLNNKLQDPNKGEELPLEIAVNQGSKELVLILLNRGARIKGSDQVREAAAGIYVDAMNARHPPQEEPDSFDRVLIAKGGEKIGILNAWLPPALREAFGGDLPLKLFDAKTIELYLAYTQGTQAAFALTLGELRALQDFANYAVDVSTASSLERLLKRNVKRTDNTRDIVLHTQRK